MQNGGQARFAGDVVMEVNPTPPDLTNLSVVPQGTVLTLRVAIPDGDDSGDDARAVGRVSATVLYGPDERTASGAIDIPTEELDAIKRSAVALLKRYGPNARAQAQLSGATALQIARQRGEYRSRDGGSNDGN